ncbi:hypothetical protein [Bacillus tuaregi]|uniref:hypothetical protein n=1 Tax=Bacillus tuaregi TaxID=1816695 RepID=UPI0011137ED8|nr:hypothetical protein [Bacillus tuaregi]
MMSFTHFDEIYEICNGMTEEKAVLTEKPVEELRNFMEDILPDASLWREAELKDAHDREGELLYV